MYLSRDGEISYFYKFHAPTHLSAGSYIVGMMFGLLFVESKEKLMGMRRYWSLEALWHCCWIVGYIVPMLGFPFIETDIEPSISTALYGGFSKHYHGFLLGIIILGVILRYGSFIPLVFNMPFFRILGRISYSYFLCHIFVMRIFMTGASQPFEIGMSNVWAYTAGIFFFGNLLAIPLALIIEFPINVIAREILKLKEKKTADKDGGSSDSVYANNVINSSRIEIAKF